MVIMNMKLRNSHTIKPTMQLSFKLLVKETDTQCNTKKSKGTTPFD